MNLYSEQTSNICRTWALMLSISRALAALVAKPTAAKIIPDLLDPRVVKAVARSVH